MEIVVEDKMQSGYTYQCSEPMGMHFHPEFKPELTPKQLLELGIFGGKYMTDCGAEFPEDWFENAILSPNKARPEVNFFGVSASKSLVYWRQKGWIHEADPRGWFQWYCRYYMGRRMEDDVRQINRWRAMRRHIAQLRRHCMVGDWNCRPRQRQALLHWAYDSRKI